MLSRYPALDALIHDAEAKAASEPDHLAALIAVLRLTIASEADPYLLTDALIEGTAAAIAKRIPPEKQGDVAVEAVRLLRDRLRGHGVI